MARRRKKQLADFGPNIRQYLSIRDGIKGVRAALDKNRCLDAFAIVKHTERVIGRSAPLTADDRGNYDAELSRFKRQCVR